MICSHCGKKHTDVTQVRACASQSNPPRGVSSGAKQPSNRASASTSNNSSTYRESAGTVPASSSSAKIPPPPASNERVKSTKDVLVILGAARGASTTASMLKAWTKCPDIQKLIGFRMELVRKTAISTPVESTEELWVLAIVNEVLRLQRSVGRDSSSVLEGRNPKKTTSSPQQPADSELHKRIGPIDTTP